MTKESRSDPEELDELGDDAIVAQQTGAHEPQRRVKVQVEARSVVVSEAPPAPERELDAYDARSNDPTVVVRDRRKRAQLLDDVDVPFKKKRNWGTVVVWLLAAATAFAVGGLISVIRGSGPAGAASSAPLSQPAAHPAPPESTAAAEPAKAAPAAGQPAVPAVDLDQLPVEHRARATAAPRKSAPAPRPAQAPSPAAAPAPKPGAIPEGI